jgi:drug/metabolite transporter (DMT)-like permease
VLGEERGEFAVAADGVRRQGKVQGSWLPRAHDDQAVERTPDIMGYVGEVATVARAELAAPSQTDLLLIAVAVTAVSTSGPLIAATAAPALAIAFWRNAAAAGVLLPITLTRRGPRLQTLRRFEWRLMGGAGVLLAAHFATWITSLRFTSVASSTALVATQPAWAALMARSRGAVISRTAWGGIALAVLSAGLLTGIDVHLSARALTGDLLALVGGVLAAGYVTAGAAVRRTVDTTTYTSVCYSTTAVVLLVVCLVGRQSLAGYSASDWLRIAGLVVGAQLLGHSVFNKVLRTTSATVVSLSILFEVPGATLIAAIFLHQSVHPSQVPAALLLLAGLALVIRSGARGMPAE